MRRYMRRGHRKHYQLQMSLADWRVYQYMRQSGIFQLCAALNVILGIIQILPRYFGREPVDDPYPQDERT